jgi:NCS1 nucleoside transporter family
MSDIEKGKHLTEDSNTTVEIIPGEQYEVSNPTSNLWKVVRWFHAEEVGVERVTDEMKTNDTPYSIGVLWMAVNMAPLGCSMGIAGMSSYGLSFWDSFLCLLFFNLLGILPVAYMSTFGPTLGMRQMVLTRFFVGYQVMRLFAAINCLTCIGWALLDNIAGAQLLHTLGHGALPPYASILIIGAGTLTLTLLGYKVIHTFAKWCWIPVFIVMIILAVRIGMSDSFSTGAMSSGRAEAGAVLSYGVTLVGNASGWTLFACDYSVYLKKTTSKWKLALSVYLGIFTTTMFIQVIGLAAGACMYNNEDFAQAYESGGTGGLLYAILAMGRFGQFCIVVLALSMIATSVACIYSSSLSAQAVCSKFKVIPRFYWALLANVAAVAISIPAYYDFSDVLNDFMAMLSYFIYLYVGIFLSEHLIYRRKIGYVVENYQDAKKMPFSYAGLFGFCCGVAGAVLGMWEVWWTGPLAKAISETFPGDIGFELAFAFAFVGHASTRWIEIKYLGF